MTALSLQQVNTTVDEECVRIKTEISVLVRIVKDVYSKHDLGIGFEDYLVSYLTVLITDVIGDRLADVDSIEKFSTISHNLATSMSYTYINKREYTLAYEDIEAEIAKPVSLLYDNIKIGLASNGYDLKKITGCYLEKLIFNELLTHNTIMTIRCVLKI